MHPRPKELHAINTKLLYYLPNDIIQLLIRYNIMINSAMKQPIKRFCYSVEQDLLKTKQSMEQCIIIITRRKSLTLTPERKCIANAIVEPHRHQRTWSMSSVTFCTRKTSPKLCHQLRALRPSPILSQSAEHSLRLSLTNTVSKRWAQSKIAPHQYYLKTLSTL
jgi:hypothetical protein